MSYLLDSDSFIAVITAVCLMQGCFTIAATMLVISKYRGDKKFKHIMSVSLSHVLLTVLVCAALVQRLYIIFPWRLPTAMLAFALSDYAILKLAGATLRYRTK